ncbi:MAG: ADP-forming succinate--CoA ligase subunit beta [Planctomycetota bacterium]|jgi:succinyl-CoA synthetase beta subunit
MKIHEYQARELLADAGVNVPPAKVITSASDAASAYQQVTSEAGLGEGGLAVVKAQVFAGGRGKAGFVKLVRSAAEATEAAEFMLSNRMVSKQTGPEGLDVNTLLVAAGVDIAKEYYLAITTDRATRMNAIIASSEGGVEIEEVAASNPDAIKKQHIHPVAGLQPHQARRLAFELGFQGKQVNQAVKIMMAMANLYTKLDCTIAEINPLIVTTPTDEHPDGQVMAIDAKFNFDSNALFRQKAIASLRDTSEENPNEVRADEAGLSFIALDGTIGCLVNGAGLAMATMDITKHYGGSPANFLDVGGSASEESVTEAFRIILADPKVNGVLVNIFGGIMSCAVIAQAVANAAKEVGFTVPLVVRLEGTDVEEGRRILEEAKADIPTMQAATDIADAAQKVCAAVA